MLAALMLTAAAWFSPAAVASTDASFEVQVLSGPQAGASVATVASGALDSAFTPFTLRDTRKRGGAFWLKLRARKDFAPAAVPVLLVHKGRHFQVQVFPAAAAGSAGSAVGEALTPASSSPTGLRNVVELPLFRAAHDAVFVLPGALRRGQQFYAHVEVAGRGSEELRFAAATLEETLARGAEHARMIALTFGALMAMSLASLLLWFVLRDRLFILYALLFSFQALYVAYFSGQGFDWPILSYALPLTSYAWNVPVALSGAAACLFIREIADLKRFSPRVYKVFGWFAIAYVALAFANLAQLIGLGQVVAAIGNLIFLSSAAFTLVVAFIAWQRGNRASGYFLIAWGVLEAFTITAAIRLLFTDAEDSDLLLFYGVPLSMVAASILVALGVADRLLGQRLALSQAELRAQTDSLTGVLNRRALIERLELACTRARTRGLPVALLFIDLDHFKQINDSYGHPAGDACLAATIPPIQAELRQSDVIGRYGGEEFVVILSSASSAAAHAIAERIRERVAGVRVEGYGIPIRVTCSIGVAASDTLGVWGEHLIAQADAAVYAAKRAGRNRVQMAAPLAA
ncbi:MAG: diguanylate cyclase [Gammaproteobacteria bacterium]